MATIKFTGWNVGMRGLLFMELLTKSADISLKEAMDIKIGIVDGEIIKLTVPNDSVAKEIVLKAREFGVICEILEVWVLEQKKPPEIE